MSEQLPPTTCDAEWAGYDDMFGVGCELAAGHAGPHVSTSRNYQHGESDEEYAASLASPANDAEAIDRAAKAIHLLSYDDPDCPKFPWENEDQHSRNHYRHVAKAALEAAEQPLEQPTHPRQAPSPR